MPGPEAPPVEAPPQAPQPKAEAQPKQEIGAGNQQGGPENPKETAGKDGDELQRDLNEAANDTGNPKAVEQVLEDLGEGNIDIDAKAVTEGGGLPTAPSGSEVNQNSPQAAEDAAAKQPADENTSTSAEDRRLQIEHILDDSYLTPAERAAKIGQLNTSAGSQPTETPQPASEPTLEPEAKTTPTETPVAETKSIPLEKKLTDLDELKSKLDTGQITPKEYNDALDHELRRLDPEYKRETPVEKNSKPETPTAETSEAKIQQKMQETADKIDTPVRSLKLTDGVLSKLKLRLP